MDAKKYVQLAIRTESLDEQNNGIKVLHNVVNLIDKIIPIKNTISYRLIQKRNKRVLHFSMGLMTEVVEIVEFLTKEKLDFVNLSEELADCLWYIAILIDEYSLDPYVLDKEFSGQYTQFSKSELENATNNIIKESGNILDIMKKYVFYGKNIDINLIEEKISAIVIEMHRMCLISNIDFKKSREINIEKLAKRYGDKFSEYNATNRKLKEERDILNKIN